MHPFLRLFYSASLLAFFVCMGNAQQPVVLTDQAADAWLPVPGKEVGHFTVGDGQIRLASDSNLFLVCERSPVIRNGSVSYRITPQNEASHTGVIIRYLSPEEWVYVGCDLTSDIFGYSAWFVETPHFRKEIARDIAKLYKGHPRDIQIDFREESIRLRIDGEIAASVNVPGMGNKAGKVGLRAHKGGDAVVSRMTCRETSVLPSVAPAGTFTLTEGDFSVVMANDFPTPLYYRWGTDTILANEAVCPYITLNGIDTPVKGSGLRIHPQAVSYLLEVPEFQVSLEVECSLKGETVEYRMKNFRESGDVWVYTIGFPGQYMASLPNDAPRAALSFAVNEGSDRFCPLAVKEPDTIPQTAAIVILNQERLAVSLDNNAVYESRQFIYRSDAARQRTFIGNNEWIYRGRDKRVTEYPSWKVIFTGDRNGDGTVNWQDGAVALAEVYPDPYGVERVKNSNVTITMNFASEAQFPFLRQLDNIKKVYYLTDGFRQMLELKGYQAEGHDTGHPDYGGHYNTRAGGLKELNTLVEEAKRYNAFIGVHINASEAHPAATAYNKQIVSEIPAWKWLDQAYLMNKEADVYGGSFEQRLNQLKTEVDGLDFIYIDTYREHRYLAYHTARLFRERGWAAWTEDPSVFNRYGVWIHYHPESKSLISRFVHGHRKDAFANDSLFGGGYDRGASIGFQGWQNGKDMHRAICNFYTNQLPYRYLMQSPVIYADAGRLRFRNGTEVVRTDSVTRMYADGQLIQQGAVVCIPWPQQSPEKVYHYNPEGGITEWTLPPSWKGMDKVYCYALTDTGRMAPRILDVKDGRIRLTAEKDVPYIIYNRLAPDLLAADWSHGSPVKDMGFDSQTFRYWQPVGNAAGVAIRQTAYGQSELYLSGKKRTGVSQLIAGLEGGKSYSVYAWVQVNGKRNARLEVSRNGGKPASSAIDETTFQNTQVNSDKRGGYYQLLRVSFTQPAGHTSALLSLTADGGKDTSSVVFDDIRWMETTLTEKEACMYFEDFEHVDFGWGGWMLARPSEAKIHLSERHDPYTDDVIDGDHSLKILDQGRGEVMRTMPSLIRFKPHTSYRIRFPYKSSHPGAFRIKGFSPGREEPLFERPLDGESTLEIVFRTDNAAGCFLSVSQSDKGMLVIDNLEIREL